MNVRVLGPLPGDRPERGRSWGEFVEPAELRRQAETWRKSGYAVYAAHLEAWADYLHGSGPRPPHWVRPPR